MPSSRPIPAFSSCPALFFAGLFGLGIWLDATFGLSPLLWSSVFLVAAVGMCGLIRLERKRLVSLFSIGWTVVAWILLICAGGVRHQTSTHIPPNHFLHQATATDVITVSGYLSEWVERPYGYRFVLEVDSLFSDRPLPVVGRLQGFMRSEDSFESSRVPAEADRVRITAPLEFPSGPRNPGEFDYAHFLASRKIHALVTVRSADQIKITGRASNFFGRVVAPVRAYIRRAITLHVPDNSVVPILMALLLGDRSLLGDDIRSHFVDTGLMHVLAVSGLHVLLVGMMLYKLLQPSLNRVRWIFPKTRWVHTETIRVFITATLLLGYMFVTGSGASVSRSVVMAILFMSAPLAQRVSSAKNTLGVAALFVLFMDPVQLFGAGFQLSFAAVGALLLVPGAFRDLLSRIPYLLRHVAEGILVSIAATLGTLPVLLYHFGRVSFAGLLLNLLAIPLTFGTLASGILIITTAAGLPSLAGLFGWSAAVLGQGMLTTASTGAEWLGWMQYFHFVSNVWWLAALSLLPLLVAARQWVRQRWRIVLMCGVLTVFGLWKPLLDGSTQPRLTIYYLDVGQGDAAVIRFPNGKTVLVDAGPRNPYVDSGSDTIIPWLMYNNISHLDAVIITHADSDHLGGTPAILGSVSVGRMITNGVPHSSELYAETSQRVEDLQIPGQVVTTGDTLLFDPSVRIEVLYPKYPGGSDPNASSIVFRMVYGNHRFLFLGDAEREAESFLADNADALLENHVTKVGHHGSSTSSTFPFLAALSNEARAPEYAVVSVAKKNRYGLPDEEILTRWKQLGSEVLLTSENGAVVIESDGKTLRRKNWRP